MSESPLSGTVALFSTRFLPYSQTFIYEEIRAHKRYAVDVFCKERLNEDRFPYERYVHPPAGVGAFLYENLAYWPRFDRILKQRAHDLIHAHFGTGAVYALPYVLRHKYPFVITYWGNDVSMLIGSQRYDPQRWRYIAASKKLLQKADLMLCVSNELREIIVELSGRPDAAVVYRHGVDLSLYAPNPVERDVPEVMMVGRFTEKKGHIYALRAFAEARKQGRKAHLTFIGSGELEPMCRQFVADHGLQAEVTFAGVMTAQETAAQLATADIVLVPSVVAHNHDREGSPTVAKEASACEVPVIATYHAGLPEIVADGETGFLVPERNVGDLADRMITLLDDAALRRQFGKAAREKMAREFDLFKQVEVLEAHYDAVR